jgi:hypothetical protein
MRGSAEQSGSARLLSKLLSERITREQGQQLARSIKSKQIVEAADVRLTDVDLRHGTPGGPGDHLGAALGIEIDADFLDRGDPRA